jgi:CheY-like chemotaxis protein
MNRSLRVLVAEDEPFNLRRLTRLLREAGCEVVAELEDGPSVLAWLEGGEAVDALFLDIQMPGLTGLDVVADLPCPCPVVFVTAYAEHAVRAFEQAATDYLLKPVTAERLAATLQRLHAKVESGPGAEAAPRPAGPFRFPVRAGEGLVLVDLAKTTTSSSRRTSCGPSRASACARPGRPWQRRSWPWARAWCGAIGTCSSGPKPSSACGRAIPAVCACAWQGEPSWK